MMIMVVGDDKNGGACSSTGNHLYTSTVPTILYEPLGGWCCLLKILARTAAQYMVCGLIFLSTHIESVAFTSELLLRDDNIHVSFVKYNNCV